MRLALVPAEAPSADHAPCASGYAYTAPLNYTPPAPTPVSGTSADPSYQPGQSKRRRYTSLVRKMSVPSTPRATIPVLKMCPSDSTPVIPAFAPYPAADTYQPRRRRCNSVITMPMPNVRQPSIQMPCRRMIEPPSAPVIPVFVPMIGARY